MNDQTTPRPARPYYKKLLEVLRQPERELGVGQSLGRYQLKEIIGSGRFGKVWSAHDTDHGIEVAIKVFSRSEFKQEHQPEAAERFCEGATAMLRLLNQGCPHVVSVYDGPNLGEGLIWFSMKLYPKKDLWHELQRRTRLDSGDIVGIVSDVLSTLKFAHAHDIVHRDIRAQNILLGEDSDGRLRGIVSDFDIAYYEDEFRQRERTTQLMGDRRHLPNDIPGAGDETAARFRRPSNDLYALAIMTLDLLTFRHELPIDSSQDTIAAAIQDHHKQDIGPDLCARLATFLRKAISTLEADRFTNVHDYEVAWNVALFGQLPSVPSDHSRTPPPTRVSTPGQTATFPPVSAPATREPSQLPFAWAYWGSTMVFIASTVVLLDWAFFHWQDNISRHVVHGLATGARNALVVIASGVGFAAVTGLITWVVKARNAIARAALGAPWLGNFGVAVSLLAGAGALLTNVPFRLKTVAVTAPGECLALNNDLGVLLHFSADRPLSMDAPRRLDCRGKVIVQPLSLATPLPVVTKSERPQGTVLLKGIRGSEIVYSAARDAPERRGTLFGVKSVADVDVALVRKLLGATDSDVFSLTVGYPKHAVQLSFRDKDLALELLRAGLAEVEDASDAHQVKAQDEAKRAQRGRWTQLSQDPGPTKPPPVKELTLRVIVQRSNERRTDGAYGYFYFIEGDPDSLSAVERILIISRDRHGRPLNGPLAYRKRGRSGEWQLDDDSTEGATCEPPFSGEAACRMVLTSQRCAVTNDVYVRLGGGVAPVGLLNACENLGEHLDGSIRKYVKELRLHRSSDGKLEWDSVESNVSASCGQLCGPPLAREMDPPTTRRTPDIPGAPPVVPSVVRDVPF